VPTGDAVVVNGPLAGLRVVDCSTGLAGPRATGVLADYGADVLWVEPPGGDPWRVYEPTATSVFARSKRGLTLDVADASSRAELFELLADADVFVENWPPAIASSLGLEYGALHERAPRIVHCSITGFGPEGTHADVAEREALVHAIVGTMSAQAGHRDGPIFQGLPFASIGAAYLAVIGILGALLRRVEDAHGRHVETSLLDGALAYHSMLWGESDEAVAASEPVLSAGARSTSGMRIITRSFECADGEYLGIHTGAVGGFGRLMQVLGLDDRVPPSETGLDMGVPLTPEERVVVEHEVPAIFASKPRHVWVDALLAADVCAIEHLHPCEVFDQPQAVHNEMVVEVDDPALGRVQQVAPPAKFSPLSTQLASKAGAIRDFLTQVGGGSGEWSVDRRPLFDGIKVLDIGAYYAGPYSSRLLADLGADVIKLEPTRGDALRGLERPFFSAQAGKRSLAADVKDPELRPAVEHLLRWADVVHHNLRPGAAERLGLDWETVRGINPRIVYLYAPGWGSSGPHAARQSFAPMMSGYVGVTYEVAGQFNPPLPPTGNEDPGNGLLGAAAILMALLEREHTGVGRYVENPQLNATMAHMAHAVRVRATGEVVGAGRLDPAQLGFGALERLYEMADGWMCVVALDDRERDALAPVVDAELATMNDGQRADAIARAFAARKTDELLSDLRGAGVPAAEPVGPNNHALMNDPEYRRTGRVAECGHPTKGNVREIGVLVRVSDARVPAHRLAPELGEHSAEILRDAGYSDEEIAALRARGAVK
jgi:crotonobetainyl-CoA:carnitine CoA-transferase CaiB-like acyl-CoA transferase